MVAFCNLGSSHVHTLHQVRRFHVFEHTLVQIVDGKVKEVQVANAAINTRTTPHESELHARHLQSVHERIRQARTCKQVHNELTSS